MSDQMQDGSETFRFAFWVITDTHVTGDESHLYNRRFEQALRDMKDAAPLAAGIMHAGDVTDHGFPAEYVEFNRIWCGHREEWPGLYVTTGNHDVGFGVWEDRFARFREGTGVSEPYHDYWINGHRFIFLGTEKNGELYCTLSEEQLQWLDEKLKEKESPDDPAFVFLHQPLRNTTAGSSDEQGWHGVEQEEELRAVLAGHPRALLFTGHTHWELEAPNTFHDGQGKQASMVNASSVAYLWTDEDERREGSQGLLVEGYEGRVAVRGRDFGRQEWIESAIFDIFYPRGDK